MKKVSLTLLFITSLVSAAGAEERYYSPYDNNSSEPSNKVYLPPPEGPVDKVTGWVRQKQSTPKITGDPTRDRAELQVKAGRSRLRAVNAQKKLDDHIARTTRRTAELTRDLDRARAEAQYLEDQVDAQQAYN